MGARRQALAVASKVARRAPPIRLTVPVPPESAFNFAALYRLSGDEALPTHYELAWRRAYEGLAKLLGPSCPDSDAVKLVGRLLAENLTEARMKE